MLNKHITPTFWAAVHADRRAVLGHFGALAGKAADFRLFPEYLTAGAEPSTRAQLQARSRATRARLSFDAPAAFQPCSAKSLSALFRAQRRARSSLKLNKEELR